MPLRFLVLGITGLIIVVISIFAIVMSTSAGTDTCESIWNAVEGDDDAPDAPDMPDSPSSFSE